jgi:hypothetical protein
MIRKIWTPVLGWVGAIGAALALALAAPSESNLLGKLPQLQGKRLHDQALVTVPQALPSDRTIAVVVFKKSQQDEAERWIDGLGLAHDPSIAWVRLPVFKDGDETVRRTKEAQLLARYPSAEERSRLLAVFTSDKEAFVRAAGLETANHASVLVLDRQGNVLAKAQGPYDPAKAQALRQTVVAQSM